jgi:hypothetical protein
VRNRWQSFGKVNRESPRLNRLNAKGTMSRPLQHVDSTPTRASRPAWAWLRLLLGNAQMFCSVVAAIMLLQRGLDRTTVSMVVAASALTCASLLVFRGSRK